MAARRHGFTHAAALLRERIRAAGASRGFSTAGVLTHWADVVGADIAALARPVKIAHGRGGLGATLTVETGGAAAPVVQMHVPAIIARVNAASGHAAVSRVKIVQAAGAAVSAQAPAPPRPAPARLPAVEGVRDAGLQDALARLGRNVAMRLDRKEA